MSTQHAPATLPPEAAATQLLFQMATGYMVSAALQTVLKLGLPDRIGDGSSTVSELARAAGVHEDGLYRVMRALASVGVFDETAPGTFTLTLAGRMLRRGPGSFHDMGLWITSPFHFRVYSEMLQSVTSGVASAEKVAGMPVFEFLARNKELSEIFNNAMTGFSAGVAPAVVEAYDFSGIGLLVDIAGGHGMILTSILRQYPAMRGVLFDLDHVLAGAAPVIEAAGVKDRCATQSGDFFTKVPSGGDAYIMKHIIHDWDDEKSRVILRNIRRELEGKPDGRVILVEAVLQPGNEPDLGKLIDLEMLMMTGGRERTEAEFAALFASAGFRLTRVVPTKSPLSVIEARVG